MANYTNSDIFNEYIKISEANDANDSKKALDKNPRADSLTKEKIGKLYNLENNLPKSMTYDNNIMEVAHPKPHVVAPAYDRINALVENNIERQNIILHIVNKRTDGLLTQRKYAQDELIKSLVRIGNDMDNRNEEELRSLADECLEGFKKKADLDVGDWLKDLFLGSEVPDWAKPVLAALRADVISVPVALGIATALGLPLAGVASAGTLAGLIAGPLLSFIYGMDERSRSVVEAGNDALEAIETLLEQHWYSGKLDQPTNISLLNNLKSSISNLIEKNKVYMEHIENLKQSKNKDAASGVAAAENLQPIKDAVDNFINLYGEVSANFKSIEQDYEEDIASLPLALKKYFSVFHRKISPVTRLMSSLRTLRDATKIWRDNLGKEYQELHQHTEDAKDASKELSSKKSEPISPPASSPKPSVGEK